MNHSVCRRKMILATENYEMPEILSDWKSQSPTAFIMNFTPIFPTLPRLEKMGVYSFHHWRLSSLLLNCLKKKWNLSQHPRYLTFDDSIQEPLISLDWYFKKVEIFLRRVFQKYNPTQLLIHFDKICRLQKIVPFIA